MTDSGPESDQGHMRRAIELAGQNPQRPFAAILVDRGRGTVVAEGCNRGHESPIWHGEMDVIHRLASGQPDVEWSRLSLYTTAEPCCMCQGAILWAGIPRVVYGTSISTLQQLGWAQIDLRAEEVIRRASFSACELVGGVLAAECDALFRAARSSLSSL